MGAGTELEASGRTVGTLNYFSGFMIIILTENISCV